MALTPYMNLDLPVPTVTLGPEWAEQLNAALEFIDAHDHTSGKGKLITAAALNINDDVSINSHNLTSARSYNMANLGAAIADPSDLRSIYAVNGELYYNDGSGNQVQITDSGGINASTIGGIGGDYAPPAAVNYNSISKTYLIYQNSTTGLRGKIDTADILLRDDVVGANAVTLKSPTSLAAGYDFRFPNALPVANRVLQISSTGDVDPVLVTAPLIDTDAVTNVKIQNDAVTTSKILNGNVTIAKIASNAVVTNIVKETVSASTTWNSPANVAPYAFIRMIGGGGGGGGGGSGGPNYGGGGGGGGGAIFTGWVVISPSTGYSITCGAGGTGGGAGLDGTAGSTTTGFGVSCTGGSYGTAGNSSVAGTGAVSSMSGYGYKSAGGNGGLSNSSGDTGESNNIFAGGASGSVSVTFSGGGGGGAGLAAGGIGGGNLSAGSAGTLGSGGGGGNGTNSGGAGSGYNGGNGAVEIWYFPLNA